ncbi:nitroreductase family protein [Microbacterium sp. Root53]|uniref:nitroreductase family protein n=1 Tax=Microbacterium sp. Root53 TaxID=1736553 RepID=UPI00138F100F|nr:nitroreductase family protein [Microbacterium sp. Root53]
MRYKRYAHPAVRSGRNVPGSFLEAEITKDYHRVEKGLALAAPKRPFGSEVQARLERLLPLAEAQDPNAPYVRFGREALEALKLWNESGVIDDRIAPPRSVARTESLEPSVSPQFFQSRHSVRHFAAEPVDRALLDEAIILAAQSPSVCNREPWRIRIYDGADVQRLLAHQNGNRGFTSDVPALALITVDLGMFTGLGERNQPWIEGGIFSSTFVWALHSLGLSSCMLNLSLETRAADALRAEAGVSAGEVPIMMVAIGWASENHRVARSGRRDLAQLTTSR